MPPKNLFGDSSEDDEPVVPTKGRQVTGSGKSVHVNETYASKYEQVKRKQELQRLTAKYGADAGVSDGSDRSSSDEDIDEGSEDDDAHYLTEDKEIAFAEVFHKIRTKPDDVIKDKSVRFFPVEPQGESSKKETSAFTLKDEFQRRVKLMQENPDDNVDVEERDESVIRKLKPKTADEKKLRDAFLQSTKESADTFDVKLVSKGPKQPAESKKKASELLHEAFAASSNDANEKFLEKFFVDELWRKDGKSDDEDEPYDWETLAKEEQDEMFYDEAEQWEREYQERKYRHEDGEDALTVQTFPRVQEGTLRKKDGSRKEARARHEERKREAAAREIEELKRLKTLKRKEIDEQKSLIAKVAGIKNLDKIGITKEFLEKDFDPEEFDKKMAAIFNHDYDHDVDDEELAFFEDEADLLPEEDDIDPDLAAAAAGSDVDDDFADTVEESVARAATKRAKNSTAAVAVPQFLQDDDLAMLYPDEAIRALEESAPVSVVKTKAVSAEDLEKELDQKVEEYWKLHYHKVAGDVRTRYRYREVNPESFGLSEVDVLTKDDRQLNMLAPMNCYATYLGKNENTRDRYKALHRRNHLREVSSDRKSRRYGEVNKTALLDPSISQEEGERIAAQIRESTKRLRSDDDRQSAAQKKKEFRKDSTHTKQQPPPADQQRKAGQPGAQTSQRERRR